MSVAISMEQLQARSQPYGGIIGHWLGMNRRHMLGNPDAFVVVGREKAADHR